jgi:hypothetical protein
MADRDGAGARSSSIAVVFGLDPIVRGLSRISAGCAHQKVRVSAEQSAVGDRLHVSDVVTAAEDAGIAGGLALIDMQRDQFTGSGSVQGLVDGRRCHLARSIVKLHVRHRFPARHEG